MRDGVLDWRTLSSSDKSDIVDNIQHKILKTDRFAESKFVGSAQRVDGIHRVNGTLTLVGSSHEIAFEVTETDARYRGQVEIVPSRWGIAPFKALLGAIRLADRVVVRFDLRGTELSYSRGTFSPASCITRRAFPAVTGPSRNR